MRHLLAGIGLLVLVAPVLAACGPAGASSTPTQVVISGVTWRAVSVAGRTPGDQHVPTITFSDGQATGSTACNEYGATVTVDGATIKVTEIVQTEMACLEDGVMDLERAFTEALSKAATIAIVDGRLVLSGPGGDLVFVRAG